jgi:hypothetical protein
MTKKVERIAFFRQRIPEYKKNAAFYAEEVLRFTPDGWQRKVLEDLSLHDRVTVRSGQGVGKTGVEAIAALWFLSCFPYSRIVATAPTKQQLNDVLWSEIAKWQGKSPLLSEILTWTKTYIYMQGYEKRWFAVARTATKPENMQGFHEDNMLFIVDEASGVADPIMEAILGTLSGENNKLLMCGNPTKTSGVFYDSHTKDRHIYKVHKVNAEDSPRTNKENISSLKRKYGADSNFARVRIFGEFPLQEDDVYIPLHLIDESVQLGLDYTFNNQPDLIHIGCDVARFGDDKTVIGYKTDAKVELPHIVRGQDTMKTADKIIELGESLIARYKWTDKIPVKIDDGGVGGGVTDRLNQIKRNNPERFAWLEVFPVKFGTRIKNKYYHDSTSYMTGIVKKLLAPHDEQGQVKPIELILPSDDNLAAQLSSRKYRLTEASKIQVESKDAMKKRGLPSPDEADCVLLLCLPVRMNR